MKWTIWERVPFPALALAALLLAEGWPRLTLGLMLLMLLATTGVGGMLMPAWMDLVARAIPTRVRGRFFAGASILGNLGGLAASAATAWILSRVAAPRSYALCFAGATACMALSFWALSRTREGPGRVAAPAVSLRAYLARIPRILREDVNFARYLGTRLVVLVGSMGSGFYTVYALRELGAEPWHAGVFSAAMLVGQIGGNIGLGWLADHRGHRLSLIVGSAATALAGITALVAPSRAAFVWVFVFQGINQAAISVSSNNILLDFAPAPESRPTYVGIGNTAGAPAAFLAPLAGGLLVDLAGIRPVFALSTAATGAGLALLTWCVREPRRAGALA
jgi:MFS family permease